VARSFSRAAEEAEAEADEDEDEDEDELRRSGVENRKLVAERDDDATKRSDRFICSSSVSLSKAPLMC
jgi:hypothetical protein